MPTGVSGAASDDPTRDEYRQRNADSHDTRDDSDPGFESAAQRELVRARAEDQAPRARYEQGEDEQWNPPSTDPSRAVGS